MELDKTMEIGFSNLFFKITFPKYFLVGRGPNFQWKIGFFGNSRNLSFGIGRRFYFGWGMLLHPVAFCFNYIISAIFERFGRCVLPVACQKSPWVIHATCLPVNTTHEIKHWFCLMNCVLCPQHTCGSLDIQQTFLLCFQLQILSFKN